MLSLLGSFCWIESQPPDVSGPLCRKVNDGFSAICQKHPGRFTAFAALPLTDISAATAELERALGLPGIIGAQVPGNYFLTRKDAEAMRPLLEVANRHHAVLFIHNGPRPGDAYPKVSGDTDNARRRNGTLDMQASLSSVMVTLSLTDYLADYPDAMVHVHNSSTIFPSVWNANGAVLRSVRVTSRQSITAAKERAGVPIVQCRDVTPHS